MPKVCSQSCRFRPTERLYLHEANNTRKLLHALMLSRSLLLLPLLFLLLFCYCYLFYAAAAYCCLFALLLLRRLTHFDWVECEFFNLFYALAARPEMNVRIKMATAFTANRFRCVNKIVSASQSVCVCVCVYTYICKCKIIK